MEGCWHWRERGATWSGCYVTTHVSVDCWVGYLEMFVSRSLQLVKKRLVENFLFTIERLAWMLVDHCVQFTLVGLACASGS